MMEEKSESNPVAVDAYHGSGRLFTNFSKAHARVNNDFYGGGAAYFTDDHNVSKTYARSMAKTQKTGTPHVYHTKLDMKNVFDVDHKFEGEKLKKILPDNHDAFARGAGLMKHDSDPSKVVSDLKAGKISMTGDQVFKGLSKGGVYSDAAREHLQKHGYDGLRYNGGDNMKSGKHNVYLPYNSDAITIHKVTRLVKKPT